MLVSSEPRLLLTGLVRKLNESLLFLIIQISFLGFKLSNGMQYVVIEIWLSDYYIQSLILTYRVPLIVIPHTLVKIELFGPRSGS